jgi:hypothetical protein
MGIADVYCHYYKQSRGNIKKIPGFAPKTKRHKQLFSGLVKKPSLAQLLDKPVEMLLLAVGTLEVLSNFLYEFVQNRREWLKYNA